MNSGYAKFIILSALFSWQPAESLLEQVHASYTAAVGLRPYLEQNFNRLYYLSRRPVLYGWDLKRFAYFLPWAEPRP